MVGGLSRAVKDGEEFFRTGRGRARSRGGRRRGASRGEADGAEALAGDGDGRGADAELVELGAGQRVAAVVGGVDRQLPGELIPHADDHAVVVGAVGLPLQREVLGLLEREVEGARVRCGQRQRARGPHRAAGLLVIEVGAAVGDQVVAGARPPARGLRRAGRVEEVGVVAQVDRVQLVEHLQARERVAVRVAEAQPVAERQPGVRLAPRVLLRVVHRERVGGVGREREEQPQRARCEEVIGGEGLGPPRAGHAELLGRAAGVGGIEGEGEQAEVGPDLAGVVGRGVAARGGRGGGGGGRGGLRVGGTGRGAGAAGIGVVVAGLTARGEGEQERGEGRKCRARAAAAVERAHSFGYGVLGATAAALGPGRKLTIRSHPPEVCRGGSKNPLANGVGRGARGDLAHRFGAS
jgi:hypothetical protein